MWNPSVFGLAGSYFYALKILYVYFYLKGLICIYALDHDIRAKTVKLVEPTGLREVPFAEAIKIAEDSGMNLVAMTKDAVPVCKILDYNKVMYEQKKAKAASKKNKDEIKEIRLRPVIAQHDLEVKGKTASRIIKDGFRVKISVQYRGRMARQVNTGVALLESFIKEVTHPYKIDKPIKIEGTSVFVTIAPMG